MTSNIHELDAETRDRIAAGEVVERPASVVKELVENALDADASRIDIAVEAGGTEGIVVSDDGVGMSEADARMAVREHTTSKLSSIDDLEAIGTLGFRGEALHAIGSVACLAIRTRPRGGDRGTELTVEGGEIVDCGPVGCPEGTTVEVTDLFENVPARRRYLKTEATEFDHVQRIVTGYALANPDVAISLEHDGRETFATTGNGDRKSAVMEVYGREVAESMIPVEGVDDDGPISDLEGLVSHPETNRAGREYMTTLVDGRYVTSRVLREAVVEAYGNQLATDRYPFAVLDVELPPGNVDVNVHPRKLEIMFADEEGVREQIRAAVEETLLEEGLLRSRAPRGRSAAEQTEIRGDTEVTSEAKDEPETGAELETKTEPEPEGEAKTKSDPKVTDVDTKPGESAQPAREKPEEEGGTSRKSPERETAKRRRENPSVSDADASPPADTGAGEAGEAPSTGEEDSGASASGRRFRESTAQRTLGGEETTGTPAEFDRLPSMTVLGQLHGTYLVAETDDGLVLVDQHAADERINYERLRERFDGDVTTQTLAEPIEVELTAREAELAETGTEALSRLGFRVQRDGRTLTVTTVPALLAERLGEEVAEVARDLLGAVLERDASGTVASIADDVVGDLACHPSVTANTSLTEGRVTELLSALDDCENPYACPHGRPTVIELSREEIDDRFERDYPGHG